MGAAKLNSQGRFRKYEVTYVLILINGIMFVIETAAGGSESTSVAYRFGAMYAPAVVLGQWWRLFTAMFLHFGLAHIASNMLSLYLLGRPCETVLGHVRMLILYLVSGVAGNVLTLITDLYENGFDPRSMTVTTDNFAVSAGASGAIFGLVGVFIAMALIKELRRFVNLRNLASMLVINLVYGISNRTVSLTAHAGGLIAGTILAYLFLKLQVRRIQKNRNPHRPGNPGF